mgnify:CR=1 FL=1
MSAFFNSWKGGDYLAGAVAGRGSGRDGPPAGVNNFEILFRDRLPTHPFKTYSSFHNSRSDRDSHPITQGFGVTMNLQSLTYALQRVLEEMSSLARENSVAGNFTLESSVRSTNDEVVVEVRCVMPLPALPDVPAEPTDPPAVDIVF